MAYYPSHAVPSFEVEVAPTPALTDDNSIGFPEASDIAMYEAASVTAIIMAVAIVGLKILRKK